MAISKLVKTGCASRWDEAADVTGGAAGFLCCGADGGCEWTDVFEEDGDADVVLDKYEDVAAADVV